MTIQIETGYERTTVSEERRTHIGAICRRYSAGARDFICESYGSTVVVTFDGGMFEKEYNKMSDTLFRLRLAVGVSAVRPHPKDLTTREAV